MSHTATRRTFLAGALAVGAATVIGRTLSGAEPAKAPAAAPAAASPWQIGCYTRPWADQDWRVALDAIAEAGFKYAGLMTTKADKGKPNTIVSAATTPEEAQAVAAEVRKRGLKVPSVWGGGIPVAKGLQEGIDGLRRLIDTCAIVGCPNLLMGGAGKAELDAAYYKAIAECCDYGVSKGVGMSIKPHGGTNSNTAQCRQVIERVGHKNFRLWYDPGNIFFYSDGALDPANDAADADGQVAGMCIKDFLPPKNVAVTPGTGKVNFPAVLARLKKGGFTGGALVVEMIAPIEDLAQRLAEAKKARLFVEGLVA